MSSQHSAEVEASFSALGGVFLTPAPELAERLKAVRGLVFDWDGVFNSGAKGEGISSTFNEADSMGVNLLRFALWRARTELPLVALITGEENPSARRFALRERFDFVYSGIKNKTVALDALCEARGLRAEELVCMFDDVNDLGMAKRCGIRVLIRRRSSPLLLEHATRRGLCDYVTAAGPQQYAVREAAELLLGLGGAFDDVVTARVGWDDDYARYFAARQAVSTQFESGAAA